MKHSIRRIKLSGVKRLLIATTFVLMSMTVEGCKPLKDGLDSDVVSTGASADFENISVDIACDNHILKGTARFQGNYYVVPKVFVASDEGRTKFDIIPEDDGSYTLILAIYIAKSNDVIEQTRINSGGVKVSNRCDFDAVIRHINKKYQDNPEQQIQHPDYPKAMGTLAPLTMTNALVNIGGVNSTGAATPDSDAAFMTWQGEPKIVEFKISEAEKDAVLKRIQSQTGLNIRVTYLFNTQKVEGFAKIKFDAQAVSNELKLALGAQKISKYLTGNEFAAAIATAHKNVQVDAIIEGNDPQFQKLAFDITRDLIKANMASMTVKPDASQWDAYCEQWYTSAQNMYGPNSFMGNQFNSMGANGMGVGGQNSFFLNEPSGVLKNPDPNSAVASHPCYQYMTDKKAGKTPKPLAETNERIVRLDVGIKHLSEHKQADITIRKIGSDEETKTSTSTILRGEVRSQRETEIYVDSGNQPKSIKFASVGYALGPNSSFKVIPNGVKTYKARIDDKGKSYFSKSELTKLLNLKKEKGHTLNFPGMDRGNTLKEYKAKGYAGSERAYVYEASYNPFNLKYFVFGLKRQDFTELTQQSNWAEKEFDPQGLSISFSEIDKEKRISLPTLLSYVDGTNPYEEFFSVAKDSIGNLIIKSKDLGLGTVRLFNTESHKTSTLIKNCYFEEKWTTVNRRLLSGPTCVSSHNETIRYPVTSSRFKITVLADKLAPDISFVGDRETQKNN